MLRRLLFLVAGWSLSVCGCSSSSAHGEASTSTEPPTSLDGNPSGLAVILNAGSDLTFLPGEVVPVSVQVSPPAVYTVHFSLVGDVADAFLDKSETTTTAHGDATVSLTAPSSPATFQLRASVPGASADLSAAPRNQNTTTLQVTPAYAGQRPVTTWVATVATDVQCEPAAGVPPTDGRLYV